ncbi:Tn3 family transposase [Vallitalea sp. AN17-2]|uniref:Tn3 family transposase n=1 Tax=Vallitalea maricola TaxID=3074433 RepID=A0ACB5UFT5_9FIRM|nr:Tn3 family transposase [Vallitalea sp. AN17-2]
MTFEYVSRSALENDNTIYLMTECLEFIRKNRIIFPAITTLERLIWESKEYAEKKIISTIAESLTIAQKSKLDEVLSLDHPNDKTKTLLAWLKEPTGFPSPDNFLKVVDKIEYIRKLNLETLKVNHLHQNRIIQIYKLGFRYEPYAFRRFDKDKRYTILAIFLLNLSKELTDKAFEIHDRQILNLLSKGRKAQEAIQKQNGKKLNEKVIHFANLGSALIKAKDEGIDPFDAIESIIDWSSFVSSVQEAQDLTRPADYDYLDLLEKRFSFLRRYTPTLVKSLEFRSTKSKEPLLDAINILHKLNETGKRKVPVDAPIEFISKRWKKHVFEKDGSINRHYYEMAVLTELRELREQVRAGDISVVGSKQYRDFEDYLFTKDEWINSINSTRLSVNTSFDEYMKERVNSLNERLDFVSGNFKTLENVSIKNGKISISRLEKDTPKEAKQLSTELYQMLPRVKLTDVLMDIADITGFHEQFTHASNNRKPDKDETILIMAALLGMGTNIGLSKMADATPGVTYKKLANISQWRMHDDAMIRAQATLVNFHNKLHLPCNWGDGTTSSSDGMRMQLGVSSLHADSNPHYGTGKGATIYRFTSDQFSSYYTKIINTNSRDATHVLDGLLNHETDLNIEEHYTDTAGYTDQVFGLTHLLGFKFAPRIRDISDIKLYTLNKANSYLNLENLMRGKVNENIIKENYEDILRLAHSIREGKVSSSLILGKLGSYSRQNSLSTALREMGKIEKSIFILDYISSEELRRKIQKGLNKGEAMNGLARAIFFGKQGQLRERTIQNQLQRASALNIIINAINIWNTLYLEKAIDYKKSADGNFQEALLANISPLGWEHINMLGEYSFKRSDNAIINGLRPLNIP